MKLTTNFTELVTAQDPSVLENIEISPMKDVPRTFFALKDFGNMLVDEIKKNARIRISDEKTLNQSVKNILATVDACNSVEWDDNVLVDRDGFNRDINDYEFCKGFDLLLQYRRVAIVADRTGVNINANVRYMTGGGEVLSPRDFVDAQNIVLHVFRRSADETAPACSQYQSTVVNNLSTFAIRCSDEYGFMVGHPEKYGSIIPPILTLPLYRRTAASVPFGEYISDRVSDLREILETGKKRD